MDATLTLNIDSTISKNIKKPLLIMILSCFVFVVNAQELVKTAIPGIKASLSIPSGFTIMSDEMKAIKYPNKNSPSIVYTNAQGSITVGINLAKYNTSNSTINDCVSIFQKAFTNAYPSADWLSSGVTDIHNKKAGYMELVTPAIDTEIYNLIFFTEYESGLLICAFNCTVENQGKWKPIAHTIMNSLDVEL